MPFVPGPGGGWAGHAVADPVLSEDVGGFRGAIAELRAELLHEGVHLLGSKRLDPAADQVLHP